MPAEPPLVSAELRMRQPRQSCLSGQGAIRGLPAVRGKGGTDMLSEDREAPQSSALCGGPHPQRATGGSGHGWLSGTPCAVLSPTCSRPQSSERCMRSPDVTARLHLATGRYVGRFLPKPCGPNGRSGRSGMGTPWGPDVASRRIRAHMVRVLRTPGWQTRQTV